MSVINITAGGLGKLLNEKKEKIEIIDVREKQEYDIVRFKDSKLIPMDEVMNEGADIDWEKEVVLVCRTGSRSAFVADMLDRKGKSVINLGNGLYEYYRIGDKNDLEINEDMIHMYF